MKVLVVGATGETGKRVVQILSDRQIPVRALVRNYETAQTTLPPGTELVVGDLLQPQTLKAAIAVLLSLKGRSP